VVAALALTAAAHGRRVLVVETGREEHVPRLLAPKSDPVGYAGARSDPGSGPCAWIPTRRWPSTSGSSCGCPPWSPGSCAIGLSAAHERFSGLADLITLGKVWHLEQQRTEKGEPRYDLLLGMLRRPATGSLLDVPRVVVSALRAGPLRRHAGWVEEMLRDPTATLLLPVALAEELPARETVELVGGSAKGWGSHRPGGDQCGA